MANIGLVFGGRSVEHLVSVVSARTVGEGLLAAGHHVVPLAITRAGRWLMPDEGAAILRGTQRTVDGEGTTPLAAMRAANVDCVFPIVHGNYGEDGALQGFFEILDLPYVGPGVATSAICMDKIQCKIAMAAVGIDVVPYARVLATDKEPIKTVRERLPAGYPLFVKPNVGGSSVGIRKVHSDEELRSAIAFAARFWHEVLVEEAVDGRELECAVLGYRDIAASRVGEIVPGSDFYDYADKYQSDTADLHVPATLDEPTEARLRAAARLAFTAVGGAGMARVDFFLRDDGALFVNEINTLPGFTSISMYPKLWQATGKPLGTLCGELIDIAFARHAGRRRFDEEAQAFVGAAS